MTNSDKIGLPNLNTNWFSTNVQKVSKSNNKQLVDYQVIFGITNLKISWKIIS